MPTTKVTIDLSSVAEKEFDPSRPLRVATVRGGKIIDQKTVTPAKEKNPRRFDAELSLGEPEDGVAGAEVVVAPADDERNIFSQLAARKFVSGAQERIDGGALQIIPSIYEWWRFCWFPRHYRITGRVVRHSDLCTYPIAGAKVEIYDVDYCWWWYDESLITSGTTDASGVFDISFTWCVPLWCLFEILRRPPLLIDPSLRDRLLAALDERAIVKFPPPPPPPDPWEWEQQLKQLGIEVPAATRLQTRSLDFAAVRQTAQPARSTPSTSLALTKNAVTTAATLQVTRAAAPSKLSISAQEIFGRILRWPPCDEPCDWLPDVKIRVTQAQPGGTVVIYEDSYWDIHFNLAGDLLNLTLEANASALHADVCGPDPILGNCMLLEAVGVIQIMPTSGDPLSGIYQPDYSPGVSYGVTPDRRQRLGYVKNYDRPWAGSAAAGSQPGVYGRFGIAAHVDYYQVQCAAWTNADLLAWDADHTHVPPDAAFAPVPLNALAGGFSRSYLEESPWPPHWLSEPFSAQTVGGTPLLYKSRERFEQEYRNAHGGNNPAPSFGGWYWYYFTEDRLFDIDTSKFSNGLYTFRFVCYRQTGVDGMGNPILTPATMGLPGGVGKRCDTSPPKPELLTLYLYDAPHTAQCAILTFKKNGVETVDECAMVTLTSADWLDVEYQAFDVGGNLDSYEVTLQKGFSPEQNISTLGGVTAVSGTSPEGPNYGAALTDPTTPAVPPYWYGGTWTKKIPYSSFVLMGGSCAYNLRVRAWDRHTDGYASGAGWGETECDENRAFTIILA